MIPHVLARAAERDLDTINAFLIADAGTIVARRVLKAVEKAFNLLGEAPGVGHARRDLTNLPVKFWRVYSYLIVYDPDIRPVEIFRVLHGTRNIGAILKRTGQ